jgi:hypothetical protein
LLKTFFSKLFPPRQDSKPISEVEFLSKQNLELLEVIKGFQAPKPKVSKPEDFLPKKFDPKTGQYVPKTPAEIEEDRKALSELGIL